MKHWARNYDECTNCHSANKPHKGNGLCTTCYYEQYQRPNPPYREDELSKLRQEWIAIGTEEGREEIAHALNLELSKQGGECQLRHNTLTLELSEARLRVELRDLT